MMTDNIKQFKFSLSSSCTLEFKSLHNREKYPTTVITEKGSPFKENTTLWLACFENGCESSLQAFFCFLFSTSESPLHKKSPSLLITIASLLQYRNYGGESWATGPGRKSTGSHFGESQSNTSARTHRPGSFGKAANPAMHPRTTHSSTAAVLLPGPSNETVMVLGEHGRGNLFFSCFSCDGYTLLACGSVFKLNGVN